MYFIMLITKKNMPSSQKNSPSEYDAKKQCFVLISWNDQNETDFNEWNVVG